MNKGCISVNKGCISVIMAFHNDGKYLKSSIESILKQTFTDFEFIIIDDSSDDDSLCIANSFNDKRIKILRNNEQSGLTKSLLHGIDIAKGEYIARMDADDIACINRFEKQIEVLQHHREIDICGTWAKEINDEGILIGKRKMPLNDDEIRVFMLVSNPIIHSSVMLRKEILNKQNYNPSLRYSQDYDLWTRLIPHARFANINEYLLYYRIHDSQITYVNRLKQKENSIFISYNYLKQCQLNKNIGIERYGYILFPSTIRNKEDIVNCKNDLAEIIKNNSQYHTFNSKLIRNFVSLQWYHICLSTHQIVGFIGYFGFKYSKPFKFKWLTRLAFKRFFK
jgi:glycosyltransferase involved in cell wall biosynthesis